MRGLRGCIPRLLGPASISSDNDFDQASPRGVWTDFAEPGTLQSLHYSIRTISMPNYEFRCSGCGEPFTVHESVREHDQHKEQCPKCGSRKVEQRMSAFYAKTSKKS